MNLDQELREMGDELGRPEVFVVMAMSADGKIATANRAVQTFGSRRDHDRLMRLRSTADAVLCGSHTVNTAPYDLGPGDDYWRCQRSANGLSEYNLRIIVSGRGTLSPAAEIFRHTFSPIIVLTTDRCPPENRDAILQMTPHVISCGDEAIDWDRAFQWLRHKWGVRRIACEGGGELNDQMFRGGYVDELYLTWIPCLVGGQNAPTIAEGEGIDALGNAASFHLVNLETHDTEVFLDFRSGERDRRMD